jgi:hypothetical protein
MTPQRRESGVLSSGRKETAAMAIRSRTGAVFLGKFFFEFLKIEYSIFLFLKSQKIL